MRAIVCKFSILFSLTGFLIGCNTDVKRISENNIQFDSLFVEKTYPFLDAETNPKCSLQINFVYPANYSNKEILNQLRRQFISAFFEDFYAGMAPDEAAEQYTENFIRTCQEAEKNFKVEQEQHDMEIDEMWYVNEESMQNTIVFNSNDLLSFVVAKAYDFGGAHGGHHYVNRVLDLKTGRHITEEVIFEDDYQGDLTKIIIDAIALSNNVEVAELENIGFFSIDEIYPNNNFFADETGITYTYNEYEIAAYVVGPVTVQLPYDKIRHLLRRESPVSEIAFR